MAPERFFLHPSAARELRSATQRYREHDQAIAADFVKAIDHAIARIVATPRSAARLPASVPSKVDSVADHRSLGTTRVEV